MASTASTTLALGGHGTSNVDKLSLVLGLHQGLQCACWKSLESFVCGSKDCELSCGAESVGEASSHNCRYQGTQIWSALRQLHNIRLGDHQNGINDVNDTVACGNICSCHLCLIDQDFATGFLDFNILALQCLHFLVRL